MRNIILNAFKEELISQLRDGDYSCMCVERGIYLYEEISLKPAICFSCFRDSISNDMGDDQIRLLHLYIYGYAENINAIYTLADETEYFINNLYSNSENVFIGDVDFIEGKENNNTQQCMFTLEIQIKYDRLKGEV